MFIRTISAMAVAFFLGTTAAAVAQGWQGDNGFYQDRYGWGYSNTGRHAYTDTSAATSGPRLYAAGVRHLRRRGWTAPQSKANDVPWAPF